MDLQLSDAERRFRADLVAWLDAVERPAGLRDYGATPTGDDVGPGQAWQRLLHDAGWAGLSWPAAFGGREATVVEQAVFAEVMAEAGVPRQLNIVGLELAGPMIMAFGTPAQQDALLGPTLRGDLVWCQLFSEPGAGSDLAGLQTAARPDGDGWLVRGQKVWTSGAHYADLGLLLARTHPDVAVHKGITAFLVPMDRPGIEVRPLRQMDGEEKFNEVFLDDVAVGPDDVLGEPGAGWTVAVSTLGRERLSLGAQAVAFRGVLEEHRSSGRLTDPLLRQRWAGLWARVQLLRLTWLRAVSGGDDAALAVLKLAASELQRDVAALGADVRGAAFQAGDAATGDQARFLVAPGARLAGGTSEIQRNILGERVLGLPREPR